jgi:hypothetical protein
MKLSKTLFLGLMLAIVFSTGIVIGAQMHMENALNALLSAKNELIMSRGMPGGYRGRAIKFVDKAIAEVQAEIYAEGR